MGSSSGPNTSRALFNRVAHLIERIEQRQGDRAAYRTGARVRDSGTAPHCCLRHGEDVLHATQVSQRKFEIQSVSN